MFLPEFIWQYCRSQRLLLVLQEAGESSFKIDGFFLPPLSSALAEWKNQFFILRHMVKPNIILQGMYEQFFFHSQQYTNYWTGTLTGTFTGTFTKHTHRHIYKCVNWSLTLTLTLTKIVFGHFYSQNQIKAVRRHKNSNDSINSQPNNMIS